MDDITLFFSTFLNPGLKDIAKKALVDAYEAFKAKLKSKFGQKSKIVNRVQQLEAEPESQKRIQALAEAVRESKADQDAELLATVRKLLDRLESLPASVGAKQVGERGVMVEGNIQGSVIVTGNNNVVTKR